MQGRPVDYSRALVGEAVRTAERYSTEEWDAVIKMIPSERLGQELIKRATKGEKILDKMTKIWDEGYQE